jgi:hypothetical protein
MTGNGWTKHNIRRKVQGARRTVIWDFGLIAA